VTEDTVSMPLMRLLFTRNRIADTMIIRHKDAKASFIFLKNLKAQNYKKIGYKFKEEWFCLA
jgi:hypothetical protein